MSCLYTIWVGTVSSEKTTKQNVLISSVTGHPPHNSIHWEDFVRKRLELSDFKGILQCKGICLESETPYILTEYVGTKTLASYLREFGEMTYGYDTDIQRELLDYCLQVVDGMFFLQQNGFAHPDLFSCQILLTRQHVCKLYDFCLREDALVVASVRRRQIKRTISCHAPETMFQNEYYTATDVWYLGVTIWEIFSKGTPFTKSEGKIRESLLPKPSLCPQAIYCIILECLCHRPTDRPSMQEISSRMARYFSATQESEASGEVHKTYSECIYRQKSISEGTNISHKTN